MRTINRRRFVAGALAGVAGIAAARLGGQTRVRGLPRRRARLTSRPGPPGVQVALLFNVGSGYEPAVGILETLGAYGVPASMFVMGWLAEQNPWSGAADRARGVILVGSHGYVPPELTTARTTMSRGI